MSTKHHPGVYAYASWHGVSIEAAAEELAEAPETDRNRVKWERVGHFVEKAVRAEADATIAQLLEALERCVNALRGHGRNETPQDEEMVDAELQARAAIKAAKGKA